MKLFVVGNESPDPEEWSEWNEVAIVVAETAEEAKKLCAFGEQRVAEIPMDKAQLIYQAPSPELWWGEDA